MDKIMDSNEKKIVDILIYELNEESPMESYVDVCCPYNTNRNNKEWRKIYGQK